MNHSSLLSLVNLGELTKPANILIEKISDAIGGIFEPYQIRRRAQAEAEAEIIRAKTQIEVTELQRRALRRFLAEEAKKQNNIEAITRKALPQVAEEAKPDEVEDDWITNFFDKCRLVSDEDMQDLWARILAGEANSPGDYSKRTVNLLADLGRTDAILFSKLCSFCFCIGDEIAPLIYDKDHSIYKDHDVSFTTLSHLESLGLIHVENLGGYFFKIGLARKRSAHYFGKRLWIEFQDPENNKFKLGHVMLTQPGWQLAPICGACPRDGFIDYVKEKWESFGYTVELEIEQTAEADVEAIPNSNVPSNEPQKP